MALAYIRKGMYEKAMEIQMENAAEIGEPTRIAVVQRLTDSYHSNGVEGYLRERVAILLEDNPDRDCYRIAEDPEVGFCSLSSPVPRLATARGSAITSYGAFLNSECE